MNQPTNIKLDDVTYIREDQVPKAVQLTDEVIIRTRSAGVHIGTIKGLRRGDELDLLGSRRLYSWSGAFTLNAVAMSGVNRANSRISKPVPVITLLGVLEILPVAKGVDLSTTEK